MSKVIDLKKYREYPVVKVTWYDAESHDEWEDIEDTNRKIRPIETVGFLIDETDDEIVLAQNYDPSNQKVSMVMVIPNWWIEEFTEF